MKTNLTGKLLIASPYLGDGNFLRSVVFIIRHDAEGAFGLSINRPSERRFRELVELSSTDGQPREDDFIHLGGPVEGPLLALHDLAGVGEPCFAFDPELAGEYVSPSESGSQSSSHAVHNLSDPWGATSSERGNPPAWITGDDDHLRILLRRPDARVKYITQYSGWGPGQLDHEMSVGGWLVGDADADLIFGDVNEVWEMAVKRCGQDILAGMSPGIRFTDPNLN